MSFLGIALFAALVVWTWKQIPPEDAETIEARKKYGKAE